MVILALIASSVTVNTTITCQDAILKILPCEPYLLGIGDITVPCCQGAQNLNQMANSTADRRAVCACFKQVGPSLGVNVDRAKKLPDLCKIDLRGITIDFTIDCNTIPPICNSASLSVVNETIAELGICEHALVHLVPNVSLLASLLREDEGSERRGDEVLPSSSGPNGLIRSLSVGDLNRPNISLEVVLDQAQFDGKSLGLEYDKAIPVVEGNQNVEAEDNVSIEDESSPSEEEGEVDQPGTYDWANSAGAKQHERRVQGQQGLYYEDLELVVIATVQYRSVVALQSFAFVVEAEACLYDSQFLPLLLKCRCGVVGLVKLVNFGVVLVVLVCLFSFLLVIFSGDFLPFIFPFSLPTFAVKKLWYLCVEEKLLYRLVDTTYLSMSDLENSSSDT
ncbi:hypothetical protein ACSBR1_015382 [Camellia fascicularis]